jgi:xanthine dehydrogenase accessory factor
MKNTYSKPVVLIRGAGEMASGIAYQVHLNNYYICLTEIPNPLAVSRANSFSDAVFDGAKTVCGVTAERVPADIKEIECVWEKGNIPLVIDADAEVKALLHPDILIDAIMAKKPTGTGINDAPMVIGIGPGFYAGKDVHIVVETNNSKGNAGRLIYKGEAEKNTGIPVEVGGFKSERVIWAPGNGVFTTSMQIGDAVETGKILGTVNNIPLRAQINGKLRGFIRNGARITAGTKLIEIDPIYDTDVFSVIRGKIWTVSSRVVKAIRCRRDGAGNGRIKAELLVRLQVRR